MNLTIFSAHHTRPLFSPIKSLFVPFWAGAGSTDDQKFITDRLIPRKPTLGYNETSQQYYVWKHLLGSLDYVGFEHYRRIFLFDERFGIDIKEFERTSVEVLSGNWHSFASFDAFAALNRNRDERLSGDISAFLAGIARYDIILPLPYTDLSLADQWRVCGQDPIMLDLLRECIISTCAYRDKPFDISFEGRRTYFCNMFVARSAIFDDYMRLWEQVIFALQASIDMNTRMISFLSERLFSLYINEKIDCKGLRVLELPLCLCEEMKVAHES